MIGLGSDILILLGKKRYIDSKYQNCYPYEYKYKYKYLFEYGDIYYSQCNSESELVIEPMNTLIQDLIFYFWLNYI